MNSERPAASASTALEAVETALRHLRVLAAALLFLHYATQQPAPGAPLPLPPLVLAVALVAAMLGVNALSVAARRTRKPHTAAVLGAMELTSDAALVFLVVSVLEVAREDLVWVALVVPVLEGALRYRLPGAVVTWAGLGLAYLAAELFGLGGPLTTDGAFLAELQTTVQRLAVVLLVSVPAGYLSEQLLLDIETQRRATQDAVRRSGLLQKVAEAAERVTQLDERVLDAVLDCASALGFHAVDVWERDRDGGWQASARRAGTSLPPPPALADATELAFERRATVIVDWDTGSGSERGALAASGLEAVVMTPLVRPDGIPTLLRTALRDGVLHPPQVECLELLAGQAGTALRNGLLVGELRDMQGRLEHQAFHDALTSLANRSRFMLRLEGALDSPPGQGKTAVLFLDLDRFKPVNDTFGHDVGNELLKAVAERLISCARDSDLVARLGGDEFAILMHPVQGEQEPELVAERVAAAISAPFAPAGHEVAVSTSIGIAVDDGKNVTAVELVRRADVAMYHAKQRGRACWQHYAPELDETSGGRARLETDLRHALERGELSLVYQPIVNVETAEITGVEALLRWLHPTEGPLAPETFIPLAEDSGLIVDIGLWVLRQACAELPRLQESASGPLTVAINVSPRQLQYPGFFAELDDALRESGIDPRGLLLEITERIVALDDCEQLLSELRRRGIRLALDDFGQGQTSLRYLRRFPLDVLKVDRSILHGAAASARDCIILRSIISLASDLGLTVVAEGVETAEQLTLLRALGCPSAQGFHLHPPMEADAILSLLSRERSTRTLSPGKG